MCISSTDDSKHDSELKGKRNAVSAAIVRKREEKQLFSTHIDD